MLSTALLSNTASANRSAVVLSASDIGKVWAHLGPWIKDFGIQFEVTAVVSDAEFAAMWPMVEAAASVS